MKLKRLIFLAMVPLVAAMGSRPDGEADGHRPYVRGEVPAARNDGNDGTPAASNTAELRVLSASEAEPSEFLWQARAVVIFADTPADPAFVEQLAALRRDPAPLIARDVVVITDADPSAASPWPSSAPRAAPSPRPPRSSTFVPSSGTSTPSSSASRRA